MSREGNWGEHSKLALGSAIFGAPERLGTVDSQDFAGGPLRALAQELKLRALAGRPTDPAALLALSDEELEPFGGREFVTDLIVRAPLAVDFDRYLHECRLLRVDDGIRRVAENGGFGPDELREFAALLEQPAVGEEASSWAPVDIRTVGEGSTVLPSLLRVVAGAGALMYPGMRHLVSGVPESMKTWIAGAAAAEVLRDGGGVLWINADAMLSVEIIARLRSLGVDENALVDRFVLVDPTEAPLAGDVAALVAFETRLVVVDSLEPAGELLGVDTNDSAGIERLMREVVYPFHRAGAATMLLDHVTKNPETRGRFSIGSQRKLAAVDVHFGLKVIGRPLTREGGRAIVQIICHKDRPGALRRSHGGAVGRVVFDAEPGGDRVTWRVNLDVSDQVGSSTWRPTALMERASRHLELSTEPLSEEAVTKVVTGRAQQVRAALSALVDEGFVSVEKGSRGAKLHRSHQPYRQADDPSSDVFEGSEADLVPPRPTSSRTRSPWSTTSSHPLRGDEVDVDAANEPTSSRDPDHPQSPGADFWKERLTEHGRRLAEQPAPTSLDEKPTPDPPDEDGDS